MLQPRTNQRRSWGTRCIQTALSGLVALTAVLVACSSPPANTPTSLAPTSVTPAAPAAPTVGVLPASPTLAATTAPSPAATSATTPLTVVPTRPPATAVPTIAPPPTVPLAPSPAAAVPTPPCVQPTLTLGTAKFRVEPIARATDGSVAVPANTPDVAYWVQGSPSTYVFALSAVSNNLALQGKLKQGDAVKIVWGDCSSEDYVVKTVESGKPDIAKLFDPSTARLSVFVQSNVAAESFVIKGAQPGPQVLASPAPTDTNAVQAEIDFLATTVSGDKKTVTQSIAIKNTGKNNISLTTKDISLAVEGAAPVAPLRVEPALPQTITAGASKTFTITFQNPGTKTAVFKILDFSADLYF